MFIAAAALMTPAAAAETFIGKVVGVSDGDTITVMREGGGALGAKLVRDVADLRVDVGRLERDRGHRVQPDGLVHAEGDDPLRAPSSDLAACSRQVGVHCLARLRSLAFDG